MPYIIPKKAVSSETFGIARLLEMGTISRSKNVNVDSG